MNLEKELEELRKRVDRLEIEQQSGKMKQDKLDIVIEQLANFAKLKPPPIVKVTIWFLNITCQVCTPTSNHEDKSLIFDYLYLRFWLD
ncbi:MAG: hypothetical protein HC880_06170 [Bacteroidia bacterium]|nr:hypothetical protein [Bacteroidia bacterium]